MTTIKRWTLLNALTIAQQEYLTHLGDPILGSQFQRQATEISQAIDDIENNDAVSLED